MYPNYWWHIGWMLLFLIAVVVLIIFLVRAAGLGSSVREPRETPEEIVKRRYARGEIDQEEYERKLSDLRR